MEELVKMIEEMGISFAYEHFVSDGTLWEVHTAL